jgi:predicted transcriptional regulator
MTHNIDRKKVTKAVYNALKEKNDVNGESRLKVSEIVTTVRISDKKTPLPANAMVFQLAASLCSANLNGAANRILMHFIAEVGWENYIGIDQKTIAEKLNMSLRSVTRGLQELKEINILQQMDHPTDKRRKDYFINPAMLWKGNSHTRKQRVKKIADIDEKQLNLFGEKHSELDSDFYKPSKKIKPLPISENLDFLNEKPEL